MTADSLILGLAAGYHYGDVRPFLVSLERTGYSGSLLLFVSDTTRDIDRMRAHRAEILPLKRQAGLEDVPYNGLRYFLYQDYLTRSSRSFDRILLTDVRDVIFQRDPFDYPWPEGLNGVLEDRRATIGSCPFNARWVREHMGRQALDAIAAKPVSCSGTTVADLESMLAYLAQMTHRLLPPTTGKYMAGYDQGVHNMLVHTGAVSNVTLHDNCGPVLTLAQTLGDPPVDMKGRVLNEQGAPAHIVHQYDRKPQLFRRVRDIYALP